MTTPWKTKQRLKYNGREIVGAKFDLFDREIDGKNDREAVNKARKYFDEFNGACSISSRHVLAFIHHDGTNYPFTQLNTEQQSERMLTGQVLHYTKAGILALALEEKLEAIINESRKSKTEREQTD